MKRYIALFLSLLMLVSLCSCDSDSSDEGLYSAPSQPISSSTLVGTWELQVDALHFTKMQNNEAAFAGFAELAEELNLTKEVITATFTSDGKLSYDPASIKACMKGMLDAIRNLLQDKDRYLDLMIKIGNVTRQDLETAAAEQNMTLEQYMEGRIALLNYALDNLEGQLDTLTQETNSYYTVENNKLYTWKEGASKDPTKYMTLHYDGTKIIALEIDGEAVDADTVVFIRK